MSTQVVAPNYTMPTLPPLQPGSGYTYLESGKLGPGPFYAFYPGEDLPVANIGLRDPKKDSTERLHTFPACEVVPIVSRVQWVEKELGNGTILGTRRSRDMTNAPFDEAAVMVYAEALKISLFDTYKTYGMGEIQAWSKKPDEHIRVAEFNELIHPFEIGPLTPLTAEQEAYLAPWLEKASSYLRYGATGFGVTAGLTLRLAQVLAAESQLSHAPHKEGFKEVVKVFQQTGRALKTFLDIQDALIKERNGGGLGKPGYDPTDIYRQWLAGRAGIDDALQNLANKEQKVTVTLPENSGLSREEFLAALEVMLGRIAPQPQATPVVEAKPAKTAKAKISLASDEEAA